VQCIVLTTERYKSGFLVQCKNVKKMKDKVLIYGAGGYAKVVIDAIEQEQKYEIVGII